MIIKLNPERFPSFSLALFPQRIKHLRKQYKPSNRVTVQTDETISLQKKEKDAYKDHFPWFLQGREPGTFGDAFFIRYFKWKQDNREGRPPAIG